MNRFLALAAVLMTSVTAFAQATVSFRNIDLYTTPADRRVYDVEGRPLVGSNYRAQLYYGLHPTEPASLVPVTSVPAVSAVFPLLIISPEPGRVAFERLAE